MEMKGDWLFLCLNAAEHNETKVNGFLNCQAHVRWSAVCLKCTRLSKKSVARKVANIVLIIGFALALQK